MSKAEELQRHVEAWSGRSFDWQTANCAHFVSGWFNAREGVGVVLPAITGPRDAAKVVRDYGGLAAAVTESILREPVDSRLAQLGDIVLFDGEHVGTLGLCNGRDAFVLDGGVQTVPMTEARAAWRVA